MCTSPVVVAHLAVVHAHNGPHQVSFIGANGRVQLLIAQDSSLGPVCGASVAGSLEDLQALTIIGQDTHHKFQVSSFITGPSPPTNMNVADGWILCGVWDFDPNTEKSQPNCFPPKIDPADRYIILRF